MAEPTTSGTDPFFREGAAPLDIIDDLPTRAATDEMLDRAYAVFVVAMQATGTTRQALREALGAAING